MAVHIYPEYVFVHFNDSKECFWLVSAENRNEGFVQKLRLLDNSSLLRLAVKFQDCKGTIKTVASTAWTVKIDIK